MSKSKFIIISVIALLFILLSALCLAATIILIINIESILDIKYLLSVLGSLFFTTIFLGIATLLMLELENDARPPRKESNQ